MKNILLVCSAGMSTSILVKRIEDAAALQGIKVHVEALPFAAAQPVLNNWDVILLSPAVQFLEGNLKSMTKKPISVIPSNIYALGKGREALNLALKVLS